MIAFCCFIPCDKDAEWEVVHGENPQVDDYTHACSDHLGHLLTDDSVHTVTPISAPAEAVS